MPGEDIKGSWEYDIVYTAYKYAMTDEPIEDKELHNSFFHTRG